MGLSLSEVETEKFLKKSGYEVQRFCKDEMRVQGKRTPDFKVYKNNELYFYCEVKQIEDFPLEKYNGEIEADKDELKILDLINNSCSQFLSVNPNHTIPNVLAFYNERLGTDILDFRFAFENRWTLKSGLFLQTKTKEAYKRVESKKNNIDMCLWYDKNSEKYSWMYNKDSKFENILRILFDENTEE